jgi:hypothetical protein
MAHIFSGLIADVNPQARILGVNKYKDVEFISLNKMTSTVLNVYNSTIFDILISWNEKNANISNTVDRFLEGISDLNIVTIIPFIVGHKEELDSVLWGFENETYNEMISKSEARLMDMISTHMKLSA